MEPLCCFVGSPGQHRVILKQVNLCSIYFTSLLQFSVKSRRCNPTHCQCQYGCSAGFHPLDSLSSPEILFWRGQKWKVLIHIYLHDACYGAKSRLWMQKMSVTIIVLPTLLSHCKNGTAPHSCYENIKQSISVYCSSAVVLLYRH